MAASWQVERGGKDRKGEKSYMGGERPHFFFLQVNQVNRSINFLRAFDSFSSGF